jgi:HSP20 family molecular chaperone IbpA
MAALPIVLGGLAAFSGGTKIFWDKYRRNSVSTPYDVIIHINSLGALATSGWEITLGENAKDIKPRIQTSEDNRGVIVAVLGSYNRGKSFLLNQLCDIKLPSGNLIHTEGISITAGRKQAENIIFLDTAGTDTAIPKDKLDDKKATEALLREIALHLCSYVIIVVNRLRATDQSYIQQVLMHSKCPNYNKNILIIHNLMDVETITDVNKVIKDEVEVLFDAKPDTMKLKINQNSTSVHFFRSIHNGVNLRHFILTKNGSDAADKWNSQSIDGIMSILQTATEWRRNLDVVNEMIHFVNSKLPQLFINNHELDSSSREGNQPRLQVQMHIKKPCIVLAHRKEMEDLEQDPYQLTLSPKLVYDDAGYFIGISTMDNGQWQPLYSLYETDDSIYAIIELAGFKKGETIVKVVEEAIIVEGHREDFKKSLTSTNIHQEKIPMGKFKLDIPLKCKIESQEAKLVRDEGFFNITCPKKKLSATFLE